MSNLLRIVLIFVLLQISVICIPIPEKNETDGALIIVDEKKDIKTTSSSDMTVPTEAKIPDGLSQEALSPENMLSDAAAISSLLQLLQKSLLMSFSAPPPEFFGGLTRMNIPPSSGEVKETVIAPNARLRVIHRTYAPPSITTVATGNIAGNNVNKVTQNQMYATQNLSVLQKESNNRKEELLVPDIIDVDTEDVPKDVLNDLQVLETIRNELEKFNSVFE